jgi:tRNA1(Val) A37 N6-methylase TrmN6
MFTQADLDSVNQAILDLATGERVVSITVAGKTTSFASVELAELKNIREVIAGDVTVATLPNRKQFMLATSRKGL